MKFVDIIRRAGRSLREAKMRTLLTSLAIGVGAFTITLSLAAGEGGRRFVSDIVSSNTDPRAVYVQAKQDQQSDGPKEYTDAQKVDLGGFSLNLLKQSDIDAVQKLEHVESAEPIYTLTVKYITREDAKKYEVSAAQFDPSIKLEYEAGDAQKLASGEAIIPKEYVDVLGLGSAADAIGETVTVAVTPANPEDTDKIMNFRIVGVTGASSLALATRSNLQVSGADAKVMYDYTTKGTPQQGTYTQATVRVDNEQNVLAVKDAINGLGHEAMTAEDILGSVFVFINVLQGILLGFGALAILTSIFGIINTQYISVLERTQQIGLMKALGMRRRDVGRLFKLEAAWIGFLGGAIGAGLGVVAGMIGNPYISEALELDASLLVFVPWHIVTVIVGLMVISVLAGILPARKAAKLDPIAALRTE